VANLSIEKNETVTYVYSNIELNGLQVRIKLFEKDNAWWYDSAYLLRDRANGIIQINLELVLRKRELLFGIQ